MNNQSGVSTAIKISSQDAVTQLDKVLESLNAINEQISKIIDNTSKTSEKAKDVADNVSKQLKNINFDSLTNNILKISKTVKKYSQYFVDYIEDLNLLKVAFGENADEAKDLVENIADITGFDTATLVRMTATFRQLSSTLGLANETADLLSTNLSKMALDVSSLYNLDLDTASYALQGALTGQPRSIKTHTGADVTQKTLQQDLDRLGIDRTVSSLNQGEKAILTYISLERQLINSNGDLARTIEQPANQLKIFKEQLQRAARSIGNLFIPVIKAVIPYLTAFLMVFSELVDILMSFLGIDTESFWNSMESGTSSTNDWVDSLNNLGSAAKNAKSGLRGFDKLNVITTPTSTSSSSSSSSLGVDKRLLDSLKEYDLQLSSIKSKATEIRDKIMEWLGFTKDANGEWKFTNVTLGTIIGLLVGGGGIFWAASKIFSIVKKIASFGGITGSLLKGTSAASSASSGITVPNISTVLKGLADIALIIGGLTAIVVAIGALTKISGFNEIVTSGLSTLIEIFKGLGSVALQIGVFSALIVALGFVSPVVVLEGISGFALIIGGLTAIVAAVGALRKIEGFDWLITQGGEILISLATILGNFAGTLVGSFAGGIIDGISQSLPTLGTTLSLFANNAADFFNMVKNVDESSSKGVLYLSEALLVLTAQNILNGLTSWFAGQASLESFGEQLSAFAPYYKSYYETVKGVDGEVVEKSADAAKSLAEMAKKLPAQDGLWQKIAGKKDLAVFGKQLDAFAPYFKSYYETIKDVDGEVIEKSANAADTLATLANKLPNQGGLVSLFTGDNTLADFGKNLKDFGGYFKDYCDIVAKINIDKANNVTQSISDIVKLANQINDNGISSTMKDFAKKLSSSSNDFNSFFSSTQGTSIGSSFGTAIASGISSSIKKYTFPSLKLTADTGAVAQTYKLQFKASGGFVDDGEAFIAREAGPELVGRIGHKTAVINNDQIISGVAQGVANAIVASGGFGKNQVVIEASGDASGLLNFIKFEQKKQDMQYGN